MSQLQESVYSQARWDAGYSDATLSYDPTSIPFAPLFQRLLPRNISCFEVGCFPGRFLAFLGKELGHQVNGIDATSRTSEIAPFLRSLGITVGHIEQGDFFSYRGQGRFDLVCSFGFVEHFTNLADTLRRHAVLVNDSGALFVSVPNFRGFQWLLHRTLDPENLKRHVLSTMSLSRWREILESEGFEIREIGYFGTFDFWCEQQDRNRLQQCAIEAINRLKRARFFDLVPPNGLTSPFMYCYASRKQLTG